jgi:hypothetical protein
VIGRGQSQEVLVLPGGRNGLGRKRSEVIATELSARSTLSFVIRLGCRRYGKLRSFFSDAIAPNTFLLEVPLTTNREQLCQARCLQMRFIWCEFLTVRATPYTASCSRASTIAGEV